MPDYVLEIAAGLIKLKPGSHETVDAWRDTLQKKEALATLIDGGVKVESWCAIKIDGQNYLLWYMRALSLDQAWKVASNSQAAVTADDGNIQAKPVLDMIPGENLF